MVLDPQIFAATNIHSLLKFCSPVYREKRRFLRMRFLKKVPYCSADLSILTFQTTQPQQQSNG